MASALTDLRNLGVILGHWIVDDDLRVSSQVFYHSSLNLKTAALVSENVMQLGAIFELTAGAPPEFIECELGGRAIIARTLALGALVVVCGVPRLEPDLRREVRAIIERACREKALLKLQEKKPQPGRAISPRRLALLEPDRFPPRMRELVDFFFKQHQGVRR